MITVLVTIVEAIVSFIVDKWLEYVWPRIAYCLKLHRKVKNKVKSKVKKIVKKHKKK